MVRSRYFGAARPTAPKKDWLEDGYNADSWSRDQSSPPPIYLRPRVKTLSFYSYIDNQGYPFDLNSLDNSVDLQLNPSTTYYDLNG